MGKAARIKRERALPFFHEQKQPTGQYRTAKDRQEGRRRDREIAQRSRDLIARLAASVERREDRG
ncbi:hypothetical protein SEA_FIZZLES_92 [Microbacterium phage Fizzles]|nr:hypothetical protein SEA_FIZZLES_92 [Microbacterium phage Fizzles]